MINAELKTDAAAAEENRNYTHISCSRASCLLKKITSQDKKRGFFKHPWNWKEHKLLCNDDGYQLWIELLQTNWWCTWQSSLINCSSEVWNQVLSDKCIQSRNVDNRWSKPWEMCSWNVEKSHNSISVYLSSSLCCFGSKYLQSEDL